MMSNAWALIWSYLEVSISIIRTTEPFIMLQLWGQKTERLVHIHGDRHAEATTAA